MAGRSLTTTNLVVYQDQRSNALGQDPSTARKLVNFIPSRSGKLSRKTYSPPFSSGDMPSSAWASFVGSYKFYISGTPTLQHIVAVSNNVSTYLYKWTSGGGLTALPAGAHDPPHNSGFGWVGDPLILFSDGVLYISDGYNPGSNGNITAYDGTSTWKVGLDIPTAPTIDTESTSTPGSIDIEIYREYVITEYDSVRGHESPPSARVRFTPDDPASYDVTLSLPSATNVAPSTGSDWTAGYPDKFRIYASHIDGSGRLFRIGEVAIASTSFVDTVPFWGDTATTAMEPLEPPYRNHKPFPSLVGAKMHNRFALRDETRRSRLWITGFAEVVEQDPGSVVPLEAVPGARNGAISDINNLSDYENFIELPDESFEIRALQWFQEGLMIGTERAVTMLWGSKPEDFLPGNTRTYGFGVFGKNSFLVTSHGLVIFTEDRKLVLDPATSPGPGDRTSQVIDIGWSIQPELDKADIQYTNRFQMRHWQQGTERDWLVVAMTSQNAIDGGQARLLIYDFSGGGWFEFSDVEATCVGIVEEAQGYQFLVGGNSDSDRKLKVLTDFTSTSATAYQAAATRIGLPSAGTVTHPACTFRTALLDFGTPERWKVFRSLSYFKVGSFTVTVKVWFDPDPADIDNLGTADATLSFEQLTSNEYRSWLFANKKRALFEFTIAADANEGHLAGIEINVSDRAQHGPAA